MKFYKAIVTAGLEPGVQHARSADSAPLARTVSDAFAHNLVEALRPEEMPSMLHALELFTTPEAAMVGVTSRQSHTLCTVEFDGPVRMATLPAATPDLDPQTRSQIQEIQAAARRVFRQSSDTKSYATLSDAWSQFNWPDMANPREVAHAMASQPELKGLLELAGDTLTFWNRSSTAIPADTGVKVCVEPLPGTSYRYTPTAAPADAAAPTVKRRFGMGR